MAGYIKLYRGWRNTDGLTPSAVFSEPEAWLWLLENCAWKETSRWNAKGQEIHLQPGQIHVSLRSLATAWGWHESSVRRFLVRLEKVKKAVQSPAQSGTILTIVNWAKYQDRDTASGTASDTAATQPRHTQEEGKEIKEDKNTHYAFFGRTIKLNDADLERWRTRYHAVCDIEAELGALDDWISRQDEETRKGWFHVASGSLNKKHQAALRAAAGDEAEDRYLGP